MRRAIFVEKAFGVDNTILSGDKKWYRIANPDSKVGYRNFKEFKKLESKLIILEKSGPNKWTIVDLESDVLKR